LPIAGSPVFWGDKQSQMETILNLTLEDVELTVVIAMFLTFGLLGVRKKYTRRNNQAAPNGLSSEGPAPTPAVPAGTYDTPQQSYSNMMEGRTHGISWKLTSSVTVTQDETGDHQVAKRHTIWTSADVRLQSGHFIFMQPVPGEYKYRPDPKEGFLGNMVKWAAETAMDGMVAAHFGEQYMSTVNLDGSQTVMAEGIKNYFIRSSVPDIARRFAEGPTAELFRQWRNSLQGFDHEEELDMTHFLMAEDGMHASCLVSMGSEDEARKLSDFCSALAAELKKVC
jgi:hypothetical protein